MEVWRVVIADDDDLVRSALGALIDDEPRLALVGVAIDTGDLVRQLDVLAGEADRSPHVVVLDSRMPGGGGAVALAEIRRRWPETLVVAMSAYDDDESRAELAAADVYVVKGAAGPPIIEVLVELLSDRP